MQFSQKVFHFLIPDYDARSLFLCESVGGSHDRTDLLPFKAGVSIMALGAMSADPNLRVRIVPVGLSYFHAHRFRSRAVVEFGAPLDVPRELVEEFGRGGGNKRDACGKLLDLIYDGLKTVTVRTPDYETLMVGSSNFASCLLINEYTMVG